MMVQSWLTMTEQGQAQWITVIFLMFEGVTFCHLGKMVRISTTPHKKRDDVWKDESRHRHTKETKEFSCTPKRAQKRDEDAVQTVRCRYPFKLFKLRLKHHSLIHRIPSTRSPPTAESSFAGSFSPERPTPRLTVSSHAPLLVPTSPQKHTSPHTQTKLFPSFPSSNPSLDVLASLLKVSSLCRKVSSLCLGVLNPDV